VIVRYLALSVSVTAPLSGSYFTNGTTSLSATATVVGGSTNYTVTFYTNSAGGGGYALAGTEQGPAAGPSFSVPLTGLANDSTNYIYAVVVDGEGVTNTSSTNTFYIAAPVLPTVVVSAPTNNQTFAFRSTITATGTVSGVGPFSVTFYTKKDTGAYGTAGTVSGSVGQTNFSRSLGALDNGTYGIYAVVTDSISQVAYSLETNTFIVNMPALPSVSISSPTNNQSFASGTSVTATGTVTGVGTPFTVTFYTNKNGSAFGPAGTSSGSGLSFTNALGALGWGTYGVYAVVTDVVNQAATSGTNIFYVAGVLPVISNRGPTEVTTGSATFNGFLSTTGNPPPSVYVLYSMTNNVWSFTNALTAPGVGWTNNSPLSTNITGLASGRTWYYTFGASNASPVNATFVASPATNLITGEVTVLATVTPTQYRMANLTNGQFTIYRPATATNEALTVSYTMSGTATYGTHYTLSPAASVTFAAGVTSKVVTVTPALVLGSSVDAILTLTGSNYPLGTASNATVTILVTDMTFTAPYKAWGGNVLSIITDNLGTSSQKVYAVHQYTNTAITGYFVASTPIKNVQVLVVAGGAGGGGLGTCGGGGGAGGLIFTNMTVISGTNTIIVGMGGAAYGNGSNSVFGAITNKGGGTGVNYPTKGQDGGSGGGGGALVSPGNGIPGQGFNGGTSSTPGTGNGGGGGAGGLGGNGTLTYGGDGGIGREFSQFASIGLGDTNYPGWFAGGGGGSYRGAIGSGAGGKGGGGRGAYAAAGQSGQPNTGGGGGGHDGGGPAGLGGSGIVIVWYDISPPKGTVFMMR
jgi:hypothetical protein